MGSCLGCLSIFGSDTPIVWRDVNLVFVVAFQPLHYLFTRLFSMASKGVRPWFHVEIVNNDRLNYRRAIIMARDGKPFRGSGRFRPV